MANTVELGIFSADNYYDPIIALTANGVAQDLTGCTVETRLKNLKTGVTITGGAVHGSATLGKVKHTWADIAHVTTTERFQYRVRVKVTFSGGKRQTFPQVGQPELRITIVPADT